MDFITLGFAFFSAALGMIIEKMIKQKEKLFWIMIISLALLVWVSFSLGGNMEQETLTVKIDTCEAYYNKGQYLEAIELLISTDFKDATSCMLYGHCLMNGLGVNHNIDRGIEYYNKAISMGHEKAESNLVVATMKNCRDSKKIAVLKQAYDNGNEMAIKFVDYILSEYAQGIWNHGDFWSLTEGEILELLNAPFGETKIIYSPTRLNSQSYPDRTRKYLYGYYYYEEREIGSLEPPFWFVETLWD